MNKTVPIIIVVLLLLFGGGAYLALKNKPVRPGESNTSVNPATNQPTNGFTSIKDALSKSLSLECTYKDDRGTETKTEIKGGAVYVQAKVDKAGSQTESQVIIKDRKTAEDYEISKNYPVFSLIPLKKPL